MVTRVNDGADWLMASHFHFGNRRLEPYAPGEDPLWGSCNSFQDADAGYIEREKRLDGRTNCVSQEDRANG